MGPSLGNVTNYNPSELFGQPMPNGGVMPNLHPTIGLGPGMTGVANSDLIRQHLERMYPTADPMVVRQHAQTLANNFNQKPLVQATTKLPSPVTP